MKLERSNGFQSRTGDVVASREQFGSPTVGSVASGGTDIGQSDVTATPDPEVSAKATRRRFSAEYKLHILKEAEACTPGTGELGALLRREGLYASNLRTWRRQMDEGALEGLAPKKRGRKPKPRSPLEAKVAELEREKERLQRRLKQAETIIDVQKKVSELLGISLQDGKNGGNS